MKNKSIHAIVKYFYPVAAGIETNMMETYRVFAEQGWDVTIHTSTNTLTEKNILPVKEVLNGLLIKRYIFKRFGFTPTIPWDSASVVALHNFDIFPHFQILVSILFRKLQRKRTPVIMLTPHGGFTPDWEIFSPVTGFIKKFYHYTLGSWLINQTVDIFRTVSEWEKEEVIKHGINRKKVVTITNGLENEAFDESDKEVSIDIKQRVKKYGKYMIQIGRIYNIKNYESVLSAMVNSPKDLNFVIVGPVGDESYKKMLEKKIEELGIQNRIFFAGVIRGIDKYYLIRHAEFMIHMARWESFCNAVHEGISQGKVVIVSDNYALPYLVKNNINGYCLPYDDVAAISEKINFVMKNKTGKEITTIEKNNKQSAKEQSWRNVSLAVQKILKQWILN